MLSGVGDIEVRDMDLSRTQVLHCSIKARDGSLEVDARKWVAQAGSDEYRPSHKGLQLRPADWLRAIPLIQELIASAEGKSIK